MPLKVLKSLADVDASRRELRRMRASCISSSSIRFLICDLNPDIPYHRTMNWNEIASAHTALYKTLHRKRRELTRDA
jgi:hypothetical protein